MNTHSSAFASRHIGPNPAEIESMLGALGVRTLDELIDATVPYAIRMRGELSEHLLGTGASEREVVTGLHVMSEKNHLYRSYLGMGYSGCLVPAVIQRNILENPQWYTQYTPYQAEISQGRLEALLNFQTMISDLTGLEVANASLLDEATAAAEAMTMAFALQGRPQDRAFFVSEDVHPQTLAVLKARAEPLGIDLKVGNPQETQFAQGYFGVLVQYPSTDGKIRDYSELAKAVKASGAILAVAADPLALTLLKPPGEWGADICVGSTQRLGVPMGFGGPHAAYLATKDDYKRQIPGRIVGVSKDVDGRTAVRLSLQTREQHIRRDKATSNICTAQVLLAVMASMYAVYHGPKGLKEIALTIHRMAVSLAQALGAAGVDVGRGPFFDTLRVSVTHAREVLDRAATKRINLRRLGEKEFGVALDETTTPSDLNDLYFVFTGKTQTVNLKEAQIPAALERKSPFLTHAVFNRHHSETEMLRYMTRLQNRDLSLANSMIPLGSCTMKLNATSEMLPVSFRGFSELHPFAPAEQALGYRQLTGELEAMLAEITGFDAISLQPNAGSQGEYAGLLVIRQYQHSLRQMNRNVCLIPSSAHGTNPASAAMVGMRVVVVQCDSNGNVDLSDLRSKAKEHEKNLSALMVTYPSTHGVFEESIQEICQIVHQHGGQVYMDGANMNAQVGLCRPGDFGADVCHLNLHKTFCIPHGGGGPGMGPIGVKKHLAPFLPTHPVVAMGGAQAIGPVSAAPWGSASILPISFAYIRMMGARGLKRATQVAILNANYMAKRLDPHFPVLYKGKNGRVAHECIVDLRPIKATSGVEVEDVAKRLMDYGFHAPTISFPVPGTMMIEPTESENQAEIDRFCEAMISIRQEIREIETGQVPREGNILKLAPHTAEQISRTEWKRPYTRERAAFPAPWVREAKFWPAVGRIDNVYGDRNLVCSCPPIEAYS